MTQQICIVKGYHKYGVYLFGKIKHMSTDHIKTALRFWFDTTWYSVLMTSIKVTYATSFDAVVVQRYVNKQKDEKSLVLQQNVLT